MDTRYYISIHGRDSAWISERSGELLKENVLANLRDVRIHSGFDYKGFTIGGMLLPRGGGPDLQAVKQWLVAHDGRSPGRARLVISETPVAGNGDTTGFELVLSVTEGNRFEWVNGANEFAAEIRVDKAQRFAKISATAHDVFQDIMLANDCGIQAVVVKHRAAVDASKAANTPAPDLYELKADFAKAEIAAGRVGGSLVGFASDKYASFASLARDNFRQGMSPGERDTFVDLWTRFLVERLPDHFLTADEAVRTVRTGFFHSARPVLTTDSGVRPGARIQHESIQAGKLRMVLSDPQVVRRPGAFVLCWAGGRVTDAAHRIGPKFGWANEARSSPRRLKLCTPSSYKEMIPLVRDGIVTPFRLFLRP